MAGASTKAVYISEDGTHYCARLPLWEANFTNHGGTFTQNVTACTTEPPLPKGIRRRKRYYQITATGKEGSVTVLDPASSVYTAALGTAALVPLFNVVVATDNATLTGRTGERDKSV